jgi:hypothetical protein
MSLRTGCDGCKICNAYADFNSGVAVENEPQLASPYFSCTLNVARQWISGLNSTVSCLLSF